MKSSITLGPERDPPSLVDLCVKKCRAEGMSIKELQNLEKTSGLDLSYVWNGFYKLDFGAEETEFVQRNLAASEEKCTWGELYQKRESFDELFLKHTAQIYAYTTDKTRKRGTILLTGAVRVNVPTEIQNTGPRKLVEFSMLGPMTPPHGVVDALSKDQSLELSFDETIPEGRIYKVSSEELDDGISPSTMALTIIFRALWEAAKGKLDTCLLTTHNSKDLISWAILFGARMTPYPSRNSTLIKVAGKRPHVTKALATLAFLLKRCVFSNINENKLAAAEVSEEEQNNLLKDLELKETDGFEPLTMIGKGAFGEVRICREKGTGNVYATKKLKKSKMLRVSIDSPSRFLSVDVCLKCDFFQVEHVKAARNLLNCIDTLTEEGNVDDDTDKEDAKDSSPRGVETIEKFSDASGVATTESSPPGASETEVTEKLKDSDDASKPAAESDENAQSAEPAISQATDTSKEANDKESEEAVKEPEKVVQALTQRN